MSSSLLTAFNDHFIEFVSNIQIVFPDDTDLLAAKNSFLAIRKMNPKLLIKSWDIFVVGKYKNVIDSGDISFFINKRIYIFYNKKIIILNSLKNST